MRLRHGLVLEGKRGFCLALFVAFSLLPAYAAESPNLAFRYKPAQMERVFKERGIEAFAQLSDPDEQQTQTYKVGGIMLVHAPLAQVRSILTDYSVYKKMIRYIDRADFDKTTGNLWLEGGIFKYRLQSLVHFDQRSPSWVHFEFIGGHFQGLQGDLTFEDRGERGTLVAFAGEIAGKKFPPRFVIEKGAEIVFGFTATRMRSFIENEAHAAPAKNGDLPQPRSRLQSH